MGPRPARVVAAAPGPAAPRAADREGRVNFFSAYVLIGLTIQLATIFWPRRRKVVEDPRLGRLPSGHGGMLLEPPRPWPAVPPPEPDKCGCPFESCRRCLQKIVHDHEHGRIPFELCPTCVLKLAGNGYASDDPR